MNVNWIIRTFVCMSNAFLLHGAWDLLGAYKAAFNPYSSTTESFTSCKTSCSNDLYCNGYSIDTSNNGCFLSKCNTYVDVPSCKSCKFAAKNPPSSPIVCLPETTTTLETTTVDSEERTTSSDVSASSTSLVIDATTVDSEETLSTTADIISMSMVTMPSTEASKVQSSTTTAADATTIDSEETTAADATTIDSEDTTAADATTIDSEETTAADIGMSSTFQTEVSTVHSSTTSAPPIVQSTGNTSCVCVCEDVDITLEESIEKRRKELVIDKTELSASIRKLTSAPDYRVSSRTIGFVGILVMVVFGLLSFCTDISAVLLFLFRKFKN